MIEQYDEYESFLGGKHFSSPKKNFGNKLFIYAGCRIIADLLDYNFITPDDALIRREDRLTGLYEDQIFPFKGIDGRKDVSSPIKVISDNDIIHFGSIQRLIEEYPNHGFLN
jgi:hypothetical protein